MASKKVKMPEMSSQERELQGMQLDLLKEQRTMNAEQMRVQDLLAPYLYKSAGIKPRMEGGKIVGFDEGPLDPLDARRQSIEEKLLARSEAALSGNLPVDPTLERNLSENQRNVEGTLAQQLGPGYATSTPGMQALAENAKRGEELRYGARTGQLTLAEQLGMARENASNNAEQATFAKLASTVGLPGAGRGGSTNFLNSLAQALGGYGGQRQMQFQANAMNAQQPGFGSMIGEMLGPIVGMGAGAFLGPLAGRGGYTLGKRLFG